MAAITTKSDEQSPTISRMAVLRIMPKKTSTPPRIATGSFLELAGIGLVHDLLELGDPHDVRMHEPYRDERDHEGRQDEQCLVHGKKSMGGIFSPLVNSFHSGPAGIPYGPPQALPALATAPHRFFRRTHHGGEGSAAAARHTGLRSAIRNRTKIVIISETAKFPAPNSLIPNTMPSAGGRGPLQDGRKDSHRTVTGRLQRWSREGHGTVTGPLWDGYGAPMQPDMRPAVRGRRKSGEDLANREIDCTFASEGWQSGRLRRS